LARFIAIDWDQQQLHAVEAVVGGGAVRVQRATAWAEPELPTVAAAEALGQRLRARLKEARISAAPVLICLGRDSVIVKDIRFPAVPESEEPAVVRFQVVKELTDTPEDAVIDYVPATENGSSGERRALALIARRDRVAAYQAICKAAGLKLAGIAPRAFGLAACVQRLAGTSVLTPAVEPADAAVAVFAVADHWAEFCVSRSGRLVFARALAVGEGLAGEIRRNLAIYNGQASANPVKALYVAGLGEHASLRERLMDTLDVPVHALDPFGGVERPELPAQKRGAFIGAIGLAQLQGDKKGLPVNFAAPKQPRPPKDPNRKKIVYAVAGAALFLIVVTAFCYSKMSVAGQQVDNLRRESANLDKELKDMEETEKRLKAIGDWSESSIVWLDELYDLSDRVADPSSMRITELSGDPLPKTGKDKDKEKAVAKLTIKGVAKKGNGVDLLAAGFNEDKHYDVPVKSSSDNTGTDKQTFPIQFALTGVKIERVPPAQYIRRLPYNPSTQRNRSAAPGVGFDGSPGFGPGP
jgi:Tfp pilus assembly PilM family ATPase